MKTGMMSTGPMQLEPNPVFSIIDKQMDKMNRRTQEREQNYATAAAEDNKVASKNEGGAQGTTSEYVSFVDGSNVMQLQKIAMQSSFESRAISDAFNCDEEQVVAYSNKRKQLKHTSKSVAKKASPKNAFFNNSTLGDMSNVWQKYRRNMHEAKQKSGE